MLSNILIPPSILKSFDKNQESAVSVCKRAKYFGFKKIGYGAYTETYANPNYSFVIKINLTSDPAAFKFYSMIMNIKSKYFPKVLKLKSYVDLGGNFLFIAFIEKLYPLNWDTWKKANKDGRGFTNWLAIQDSYINIRNITYKKLGKIWESNNTAEVKIFSSIVSATSGFSELDLHEDNLMMRLPEGDIILNDPIAPFC
jgi:hypothetical protein